jgi:hypothetical protein
MNIRIERTSDASVLTEAAIDAAAKRVVDAVLQYEIGAMTPSELLSFAAARLRELGVKDLSEAA